jgi:hypothetical protein
MPPSHREHFKKEACIPAHRPPHTVILKPTIILQPSITASLIADFFANASGASTAFSIMPRNGHSSGSRRCQRSDDRHSSTSDRSASVPFDTASTYPSISNGWTSIASADDTAPSDISTNSGPNPPPVQLQGLVLGFDASLPPHPQAAFDDQQMDPWQGYPSQPDPYQGHYAASSPEAIGHEGYGSPGNSDGLANSTVVSPGSLPAPSPPR